MERLRVDTDRVQTMATRWGAEAGELGDGMSTAGLGLSCQTSAAAMHTGHADIAGLEAALAARLQASATKVAAADTSYIANEVSSAATLAAVSGAVTAV